MRTRSSLPSRRTAFTLIELLVVISIIVVLMGILLPVIKSVQIQARAADTKNQIAHIGALFQAYYNDFNSYPGPIPNTQLRGAAVNNVTTAENASNPPQPITPWDQTKITMAENAVLGLLGGLKPGATAGQFTYSQGLLGQGPRSLGPVPKKVPAYGDTNGLSAGDYKDDVADADDSIIPEFVDRFPQGMPILVMRARVGVVTTPGGPVVTATPTTAAQYDQTQVTPYTAAASGAYIGEGKVQEGEWTLAFPQHGFNDAPSTASSVTTPYPLNIHAALRHPTLPDTPRQKDSFILISAGADRVYGTRDDITNFDRY